MTSYIWGDDLHIYTYVYTYLYTKYLSTYMFIYISIISIFSLYIYPYIYPCACIYTRTYLPGIYAPAFISLPIVHLSLISIPVPVSHLLFCICSSHLCPLSLPSLQDGSRLTCASSSATPSSCSPKTPSITTPAGPTTWSPSGKTGTK